MSEASGVGFSIQGIADRKIGKQECVIIEVDEDCDMPILVEVMSTDQLVVGDILCPHAYVSQSTLSRFSLLVLRKSLPLRLLGLPSRVSTLSSVSGVP